jgi:hypothetical protein
MDSSGRGCEQVEWLSARISHRCNSSVSWEWTGGNHIEEECLSEAALAAAAAAGPVTGSRPVPWCDT